MCAKKAVIVIRHGEKDDKNEVRGNHVEEDKGNLPSNNYYFEAEKRPDNGKTLFLNYTNLSERGYKEGRSFPVTVPKLISDLHLAGVKKAFILDMDQNSSNANTYITSYLLLKKLVATLPFELELYHDAKDLKGKLDLNNYDGSILVAGTAEVLAEEGEDKGTDEEGNGKDSILYYLNQQYKGKGDKLHRGIDIDVYSYEDGLQRFAQDPDNQTYHKI